MRRYQCARFAVCVLLLLVSFTVGCGIQKQPAAGQIGVVPVENPPSQARGANSPQVTIEVQLRGHAAAEIELLVAIPLEQALHGASRLERVQSISYDGVALIHCTFAAAADVDRCRAQVAERLAQVQAALPEGAQPLLRPPVRTDSEYMLVALQSAQYTAAELHTLANRLLRRRLLTAPGVIAVDVSGEAPRCEVVTEPDRLRKHNLTPIEVATAVSEAQLASQALSMDDLGNAPVAFRDGVPVLVKDVAQVRIEAAAPDTARISGPGAVQAGPAVVASIVAAAESLEGIQRVIEACRQEMPAAVVVSHYRFSVDDPRFVLRAPQGTSPEQAADAITTLAGALGAVPGVRVACIQRRQAIAAASMPPEWSIDVALDRSIRRSRADVIQQIRAAGAELPGMRLTLAPGSTRYVGKHGGVPFNEGDVQVCIFGDELQPAFRMAEEIRSRLAEIPGVVDINVASEGLRPRMNVSIRRDAATVYGLKARDVADTIQLLAHGRPAGKIQEGGNDIQVVVLFESGDVNDKPEQFATKLDAVIVAGATGATVALSQLVDVEQVASPVAIERENHRRVVRVTCNIDGRDAATAAPEIRAAIAPLEERYGAAGGNRIEVYPRSAGSE